MKVSWLMRAWLWSVLKIINSQQQPLSALKDCCQKSWSNPFCSTVFCLQDPGWRLSEFLDGDGRLPEQNKFPPKHPKYTLFGWIGSVLHQDEGGIGKSIPDAQENSRNPKDFPRAKPEGNREGRGDGFPNTSRVLVERGYNISLLSTKYQ